MATITLPIWTIGAAIGLPTICLVWLIVSLVRKKRKLRASAQKTTFPAHPPESELAGLPFYQDLFLMQIDAVFDGLSALIETERHKLKRMLDRQTVQDKIPNPLSGFRPAPFQAESGRQSGDDGMQDQGMSAHTSSEQQIQDIASRLGVSAAEAELAMKFQNLSGPNGRQKLEAVA